MIEILIFSTTKKTGHRNRTKKMEPYENGREYKIGVIMLKNID